MITEHKYFLIRYADVPERPAFNIWSSTWSTMRPELESSDSNPMLVAFTDHEVPSTGVLLAISPKDPPPPPPPPLRADEDLETYRGEFETWLADAGRGGLSL